MGLKDEFKRARDWVATDLSFDKPGSVSLFETNIRIVGGLLSAYDFSGDGMFLAKVLDLGKRLLPAFDGPGGEAFTRHSLGETLLARTACRHVWLRRRRNPATPQAEQRRRSWASEWKAISTDRTRGLLPRS